MIHSNNNNNNNNNNIFLTELENNMFTIKNISKIPEFIVNATDSRQSRQSNNRNNVINAANNIFYPKLYREHLSKRLPLSLLINVPHKTVL